VVLMISVFAPDTYDAFFLRFASSYFSLDLITICIVLLLFAKSLTDAIAATRAVEKGGKSGAGTKGLKSSMDDVSSRVGSRTTAATSRAGADSSTYARDYPSSSGRSTARSAAAGSKPGGAGKLGVGIPGRKGTGLGSLHEEEIELAEVPPLGEHGVDFGDWVAPEEMGGEVYEFGDDFEPGSGGGGGGADAAASPFPAIELTTLGRVVGAGGASGTSVVALDLSGHVPQAFAASSTATEMADFDRRLSSQPLSFAQIEHAPAEEGRTHTVEEVGDAAAALVQSMLASAPGQAAALSSTTAAAASSFSSPPKRTMPTIHPAGSKPFSSSAVHLGSGTVAAGASDGASRTTTYQLEKQNSFARRPLGSTASTTTSPSTPTAALGPRQLPPLASRRPLDLSPSASASAIPAAAAPPSNVIRVNRGQMIRLTRTQTLASGVGAAASSSLTPIPATPPRNEPSAVDIPVSGFDGAASPSAAAAPSPASLLRSNTAPRSTFKRRPSLHSTNAPGALSAVDGSPSHGGGAAEALAAAAAAGSLTRMQSGLSYLPASRTASPGVLQRPTLTAPYSANSRLAAASRSVGALGSSPSLSLPRASFTRVGSAALLSHADSSAAQLQAQRPPPSSLLLDSDED
jgi:hypothetical protein